MIYCSMLSILGAAGLTGSPNIGAFITFRFFAGAGMPPALSTGSRSNDKQPLYTAPSLHPPPSVASLSA